MPKHYARSIYTDEQTEIDWVTAKAHFTSKEILYKGLDYCLKHCPKPPKKTIKQAKEIVK